MNSDTLIQEPQIQLREANGSKRSIAADVLKGLTSTPKFLHPKYFYDERGSRLFERICELPEYYQTRTERKILQKISDHLIEKYKPTALVEYGAGAATKTRLLLDAMEHAGSLRYIVPIDVSEEFLEESARELAAMYPRADIHGLIGDFIEPIDLPYQAEPRLIIFLGSTIGNLTDREADRFLHLIADQMNRNDLFLLGTDLVKDVSILEDAYNDAQGITAEFNLNMLRNINRALDGTFDPGRFRHHAFYNEDEDQIEMHLIAREDHTVALEAIDTTVEFQENESIRTELSCKYTRQRVEHLLQSAGLTMTDWFTDENNYFALSVSRIQ
ncbi:MAG TPA: L-histidine N(alpha)-methyltransferase [bacterium]|nr:L-histidine N(alpha)-methyltransferase [bacterium]